MTQEKRQALLEKEEYHYRINESFLRSILKFPPLTEKEIEFHLEACKEYLDAGYEYDGENSPFVIGSKGEKS